MFELLGGLLIIAIIVAPVAAPIHFGRSFFKYLLDYRSAKLEGGEKLGGKLINLIAAGILFFGTAAFLIYILIYIILIFTGVISFM
ncbi:MAG: hypothetical protein E7259_05180 [Lachnospiraceae bacterium]|nr:hypothetical protein [Lachnospiraceae bacterium]